MTKPIIGDTYSGYCNLISHPNRKMLLKNITLRCAGARAKRALLGSHVNNPSLDEINITERNS